MIIDNTAALQYLFTEDIYLTKKDVGIMEQAVTKTEITIEADEKVLIEAEQITPLKPVSINFSYLGNNQKQFLIVSHYTNDDHMDGKHLDALKSALLRKELSLDDVAILNVAKFGNATADDLLGYFKPLRLLLLGARCLLTGWDKLALNQLTEINATKILYSYSFTEMMGDRDKTKAFWEQMKVL